MKNLLLFLHVHQESMQDILESTKSIYFVILQSMEHDIERCAIAIHDIDEKTYWKCQEGFESRYFDGNSIQDLANMVHAAKTFEDLDAIYQIISPVMEEYGYRLGSGYYK